MNHIREYFNIALHNIRHNKAYAIFCFLSTVITFIFIIIVIQLSYTIISNDPPLNNADRTIRLEFFYGDAGPDHAWNKKYFFLERDIMNLNNLIKDYEACGISHMESVNPLINGQLKSVIVNFVNSDYWRIKDFEFIEGRAFDDDDYNLSKPVAVIKESNAIRYFGSVKDAIDKEIEFQGNTYHVIGVIGNFSLITGNEWSGIWVPHKYNKGVPSGWMNYVIEYMFPQEMLVSEMKEKVWKGIHYHFEQQDKDIIEPAEVYTVREEIIESLGGEMFKYGVFGIIFILLVVPALNILALNKVNTDNRTEEIAICRAMGSTRTQAFMRIMTETILLVITGALVGLALVFPVIELIENKLLDLGISEGSNLIAKINPWVFIIVIIPIAIIFAFMFGGIPAYKVSQKNISVMLKGDDNGGQILSEGKKSSLLIYIEQAVIFFAIMICIVSIYKMIDIIRSPGMLDTKNILIYGYSASAQNDKFNWRDVAITKLNMSAINEELTKKDFVLKISESHNFIPYGATADNVIFTLNIDDKIMNLDFMAADPEALDVFKPILDEGEWFSNNNEYELMPSIITRQLADSLHWDNGVNRKITLPIRENYSLETHVIGVLSGIKKDLFKESQIGIVIPSKEFSNLGMTASGYFSVRLDNDLNKDDFTNEYYRTFMRRCERGSALEAVIFDLNRYKNAQFIKGASPLIAQTIPTLFFLIFGFLGTFGHFWLNIQKRKTEFALRRAVGSTKFRLKWLILIENLLFTMAAMVPGLLLSFFLYNFIRTEILGILTAIAVMLFFSFLSLWYPAYKASHYSPAETLSSE
ncbi:ABC transporter permease [Dysgonomonas sp. Marseille-P4677]|uniref:ABC transporter permease n=1 Tax=Dysgonomonas sp. Marseille-P4677 TaxID=2364790 RepID=UPI001913544E|nr:FtsX-like permease family protein [Dysgonomonas sp. Marseille-P4677]MBK5722218.1 ABC transporter permease [Dysgonomonas sp. Marseille-P4677]